MLVKIYKTSWITIVLLIAGLYSVAVPEDTDDTDPVLKFYTERAKSVSDSRNPIESGLNFSFQTRSYYKKVNKKGVIVKTDSSFTTQFYSYGNLDSLIWDSVNSSKEVEIDWNYPNIFNTEYEYNFYPNDTGGTFLAIGFDIDTTVAEIPVGLAIIDRNHYFMHWLFLHFPHDKLHDRYSKSFRFTDYSGIVMPDSIWVVGAKSTTLSTEYYRIETSIYDFNILR